ncbi:putative membrane protein [Pedobacter cryoconitis]|uniref:SRPBCC family protein n=1 Tax=Pedobacter cryoconitis TaxID=188932 RepID=UPI001621B9E0|nr:SRPBCC family protein [Pedobacter cryoconitis]MBB6272477.1 putative membrane protein [Pedobacter cryoconitis]
MKNFIKITALVIGTLALIIAILEMSSSYKMTRTIHTDAPVINQLQITIDAPVETVWKVFADVDNWSQWQKEIPESKINGPFKTGASFDWKTHGLTIHSTFHTVNTNSEIGWSGPALGSFAIHNWHFIRQGNHTVVKVEESMEGWLVWLLKDNFQTVNRGSLIYWLNALKIASEKKNNPVFSS